MEDKTKVAKKKTWWDKTDILEAFLDVAHDSSCWISEVSGTALKDTASECISTLGEVSGAAKLAKKLLEMTDAN